MPRRRQKPELCDGGKLAGLFGTAYAHAPQPIVVGRNPDQNLKGACKHCILGRFEQAERDGRINLEFCYDHFVAPYVRLGATGSLTFSELMELCEDVTPK